MTVLYLDTEFNGFGGGLISLALFAPAAPEESFYEVVYWGDPPTPWVTEHVLPVLDRMPIPRSRFEAALRTYLRLHDDGLTLVADWPADFEHFFSAINPGQPWVLEVELTCLLVSTNGVDLKSERPHNALSDARALWEWHRKTGYGLMASPGG